jgi:hypothetical protein
MTRLTYHETSAGTGLHSGIYDVYAGSKHLGRVENDGETWSAYDSTGRYRDEATTRAAAARTLEIDPATPSASLTSTQDEALTVLRETGRQWPLARGRNAGDGPGQYVRYSRRTLQALVDAGLAQWAEYRSGVLPHVVPAGGQQ